MSKEHRAKGEERRAKNPMLFALCSLLCALCSVPYALSAQPAFDAGRAFGYLQKQCEFGPRPPGSVAHKQTLDYLLSELKKFAREVVAQDFTHRVADGPLRLTNIIATFGPEADEKVLLAAHWDTRPFADRDPDPQKHHLPILGANDGASGVAVLLELSRAFHSKPPDVQVVMVLFDGEDYGKTEDEMLLGSRYFARNMDDRWRPEYGILIDMVGDKDLDIYIEPNSAAAAPDIVKKVWGLADELRLEGIYREPGPAVLDDHIPLIKAGIKCIDIIDFNYSYWHSVEDTPDKCSPKSLETVGRLLLELIYREGSVASQ
jgi:acetylornithine deacetylase/succinyl-diaminopimelate desuccinylase-like protein